MYSSKNNKVYVVCEGRQPGIYWSWVDFDVQVNGLKGNRYQPFDTYEEAEGKWVHYCNTHGRGKAYIQRCLGHHRRVGRSTCDIPGQSQNQMGRSTNLMPEDTDSNVFILQGSMQKQLMQMCKRLGIPSPIYTLHEMKVINGCQYVRYYASLACGGIGTPTMSIGRFGKDEYDAKEDVAAHLIRRLLTATKRKIRDLNHYNVEILEAQLQKTMDDNIELEMKI